MSWVTWLALAVIGAALIRPLCHGLGPPWRWLRRSPKPTGPDPFTVLHVQHRLSLIATELRVLEANDADRTYYARAHRIHTRRSAYDQLLAEACELAGVPARHPGPDGRICRNADERFSAEIELAARGWHW
jgi:hypothetical protein